MLLVNSIGKPSIPTKFPGQTPSDDNEGDDSGDSGVTTTSPSGKPGAPGTPSKPGHPESEYFAALVHIATFVLSKQFWVTFFQPLRSSSLNIFVHSFWMKWPVLKLLETFHGLFCCHLVNSISNTWVSCF